MWPSDSRTVDHQPVPSLGRGCRRYQERRVTDPPAMDGTVGTSPARTNESVTVTIGGQEERVLSTVYPAGAFPGSTGLAPALVGVNEVEMEMEMPTGVTPDDAVPGKPGHRWSDQSHREFGGSLVFGVSTGIIGDASVSSHSRRSGG